MRFVFAVLIAVCLAQNCPDVDGFYGYQSKISQGGGASTAGGPNGVWKFALNLCGPLTQTNNCASAKPGSTPLWGCQSYDPNVGKLIAAGNNNNQPNANPTPGAWTVTPMAGNAGLVFTATGGDASSSNPGCFLSMQVTVSCDATAGNGIQNLQFMANSACPNTPFTFTAKSAAACQSAPPPPAPPPIPSMPSPSVGGFTVSIGIIVGASVGGVVLLAVIFLLCYCACRKKSVDTYANVPHAEPSRPLLSDAYGASPIYDQNLRSVNSFQGGWLPPPVSANPGYAPGPNPQTPPGAWVPSAPPKVDAEYASRPFPGAYATLAPGAPAATPMPGPYAPVPGSYPAAPSAYAPLTLPSAYAPGAAPPAAYAPGAAAYVLVAPPGGYPYVPTPTAYQPAPTPGFTGPAAGGDGPAAAGAYAPAPPAGVPPPTFVAPALAAVDAQPSAPGAVTSQSLDKQIQD